MAWPIGYAVGEKHADHLEAVIDLAKQADELVNAGDPDPEGQRLVDEVIEYAGLNGKPVKRILINDNTPSAIRDAVARIEDNANYRGLSLSALAGAFGQDAEKADEAGGIGTPATRDTHIETLFHRGFLAEKGKQILSTELGRSFHGALTSFAVKPDLTALWHEKQRLIERGELNYQSLLADIDEVIEGEICRVRSEGLPISVSGSVPCPVCKEGALRRIKGREGFFWGCGCYPACKVSFPDKKGKPDTDSRRPIAMVSEEHTCSKCEKGLIWRESARKQGVYWWGCSGFPACNFRAFDENGKPKVEI